MGLRGPARTHPVRDGRRERDRRPARNGAGGGEAADSHQVRHPLRAGEGVVKAAEMRELTVDDLRAREKELDDQLFRLRIQKSMGQLEAPAKVVTMRRDLARIKTIL